MSIPCTKIRRIHRDEEGTISIVAVFAVMLFTMLLGMVINTGRQVDGKIRLQNAADATAHSGGVVLARGMNAIAFTNHLLCDVFATTAFLREARDRNAEAMVPSVLAAWKKEGPVFDTAEFQKFKKLGAAIPKKVPLEQKLVTTYSAWAAGASAVILPLLDEILKQNLIPQYQRAVAAAFPDIAQAAAMEAAVRNSNPDYGRGTLLGVLWRSSGRLVGGDDEEVDPTLPTVDPLLGALSNQPQYLADARKQRNAYASRYLDLWNYWTMWFFERQAKMSQFGALWRSFSCGQLNKLLNEEYPDTNLPFMIRTDQSDLAANGTDIEQHFTFLGVAYWKKPVELMPKIFTNPLLHDAVAYAEVKVFVPKGRIEWWVPPQYSQLGGVPGEFPDIPSEYDEYEKQWVLRRRPVPQEWDLWNQHWVCQLAPTTLSNLATILQSTPPLPAFAEANFMLPNFGNLSTEEIGRISPH